MKSEIIVIILLIVFYLSIIIRQFLIIRKLEKLVVDAGVGYTNAYNAYQELYAQYTKVCDNYKKTSDTLANTNNSLKKLMSEYDSLKINLNTLYTILKEYNESNNSNK